jgi:hypothetical protein
MRNRMIGLLLLSAGSFMVAAGGSLTRLGHEQYLYLAMSIGVALMYWSYRKTIDAPFGLAKDTRARPDNKVVEEMQASSAI